MFVSFTSVHQPANMYIAPAGMLYCITGIFPGTFISRKMMFSTFSRFLISRPAHGCTDIKLTESVCFHF